jgi:hypothetical protein
MSFLRNTDVKKHLSRAAPRSVSPNAEKIHETDDDIVAVPSIYEADPIPAPVKTDEPLQQDASLSSPSTAEGAK